MSSSNAAKTLNIASDFGYQSRESGGVGLKDILAQLQGLRVSHVVGGAQSANLSLRGPGGSKAHGAHQIISSDVIIAAIGFGTGLTTPVTYRSDVVCRATGSVRFTGGATTAYDFLLFWFDTTGFIASA